jgi:hypothetical protein
VQLAAVLTLPRSARDELTPFVIWDRRIGSVKDEEKLGETNTTINEAQLLYYLHQLNNPAIITTPPHYSTMLCNFYTPTSL